MSKGNQTGSLPEEGIKNSQLRIRTYYDAFGAAEKKIADWLLENPDKVINLSIVELASLTGASEATIARFSRKLGYGGFKEMKIAFAQETTQSFKLIHESVTKDDDCAQILDKVIGNINDTLIHTRKVLNSDSLSKAAEYIQSARKILIIGMGASAAIAADAEHKFSREGLDCIFTSDSHMQMIHASHLTEKDVVLAISHSGYSRDILDTLCVAKESGAKTISISNYGKAPILKYSDVALHTASDETRFRVLALSSRIAQLAIIDTLYLYIATRRDKSALTAITLVEKNLETKKV